MRVSQKRALSQLQEFADNSNGLYEILEFVEPEEDGFSLKVTVSLSCSGLARLEGGIPFRERERFIIYIPADFPFAIPWVEAPHTRFAGFNHVQWKRHLCLYQSAATEWDVSDEMYGFMDRLGHWLERAALGEWEAEGEPLHPPVAYASEGKIVIPRANTPVVERDVWVGKAHLKVVSEHRVDIVGWSELEAEEGRGDKIAAAILFPASMPFEFPSKLSDLLKEFLDQGVSKELLISILQDATSKNTEDDPLYIIIGCPMRGIQGSTERKQHLIAWYLPPNWAWAFRILCEKHNDNQTIREIVERVEGIIDEWSLNADVSWCSVREARDEVLIRRDHLTPMSWFEGKSVALWGCGALGGHVAETLTRAGVKKIVLRDSASVAPGILVRQPFDDLDIGRMKSAALADKLRRIRPDLEIEFYTENILSLLNRQDFTDGAELIIDTTASGPLISKLELRRKANNGIPIVSMAVGHKAERALVVISGGSYTGGPYDLIRKAKLEACSRPGLTHYSEEFWPKRGGQRRPIFQPEPGCSESTFVGSDADLSTLASSMLNLAAKDLSDMETFTATAHFLAQPYLSLKRGDVAHYKASFKPDLISIDPETGYEIRIASSAWADLTAWVKKSNRERGVSVETGGILFGERDLPIQVIWVSELIGPPADSKASEEHFICGVTGTKEVNDEKKARTRGSVQYIGMWHSHPQSSPAFSGTDLEGMRQLLEEQDLSPSELLLLIVGTPESTPRVGTYVFNREYFRRINNADSVIRVISVNEPEIHVTKNKIGLALSGGGSRAIAFHLGCLRALHDRGVLSQIDVISSVSGGSVISAMYAYNDDSFEGFEIRVRNLLRKGLVTSILRESILSFNFPAAILTNLVAGTASLGTLLAKNSLSIGNKVVRIDKAATLSKKLHAPFPRWKSITSAFERALNRRLFGNKLLTDLRRDNLEVVINACDLRSGSAFRFGATKSGCWTYGKLTNNDLPVALAVAASAAYPILLPAIDKSFEFENKSGSRNSHRVVLTDGGIFDNLGTTCLEPGRSELYSDQIFNLDYIICCDAGPGLFSNDVYPFYWPGRIKRSFEASYRKANDSVRARLYGHFTSGALKGIVHSYLGQNDKALPYIPSDFVRREEVFNYPTNFSPMSESDIKLLTDRGEQLTRMLLSQYCPEL